MLRRTLLGGLLLLVAILTQAQAETLYVRQDGSGDFTVIQDAVDAASEGDLIDIGPGVFREFGTYNLGWGDFDAYVLLTQNNLTLVGAGSDQTSIGPESIDDHTRDTYGIIQMDLSSVIVLNLRFVNINYKGIYHNQGHLEVEDCVFENGNVGIIGQFSAGAIIRNCTFQNLTDDGISAHPPSNDVLVEDCQFTNVRKGYAFNWSGTQNCRVLNCTFTGGVVGGGFYDGATGEVYGCSFSGQLNYGMTFLNSGSVDVRDNVVLEENGWGMWIQNDYPCTFRDNIIYSAANCLLVTMPVEMEFHNNHILRAPGGFFARTGEYWPWDPFYIDVTENYWGTTDLDEIAEWIFDGHDDPNVNLYFVYEPIAQGPVPTQQMSWGGLKELYRPNE